MTQKVQSILLQDLCARLPYGVNVRRLGKTLKLISIRPSYKHCVECEVKEGVNMSYEIDDFITPYLRPMSSMTEEEMERLTDTHSLLSANGIPNNVCCTVEGMDYLNSIHVDYRGLIPMGLALEAPEDMYKIE